MTVARNRDPLVSRGRKALSQRRHPLVHLEPLHRQRHRLLRPHRHHQPLARVIAVYSRSRWSIGKCWVCTGTTTAGYSLPWLLWAVVAFDRHHVSFVSVTQQFNTTYSMGRLTLNILLSFAQFEREISGGQ